MKDTVNAYRLGVDFRLLPRTNISYDEILTYYKGDTGQTDNNQNFSLANGTPVDLGVSFNSAANQPCGGTFAAGRFREPGLQRLHQLFAAWTDADELSDRATRACSRTTSRPGTSPRS